MRQIPLSYRSHVTGFRHDGRSIIEHESALERDFVTLTMFLDRHACIASQPVTITFAADGRSRRYTPDFEIMYADGRLEIVEIKYHADLREQWASLRPAFEAARVHAQGRNARFRIVTERAIRGELLENAKRLLPLRGTAIDRATAKRLLTTIGREAQSTIGDALAGLDADRAIGLSTMWRLIAAGHLMVDLRQPITAATTVRAR